MIDFWSFLLQTLTASGAAVLLLAVKAMFRDKLSSRWQFGVWGVLAAVMLLPAGWGGRYSLLNWPMVVEVLKSLLTGEFGTLTKVSAPVPLLPTAPPGNVFDWLFLVYEVGVALLLARYAVSYIRLRLALGRGRPVRGEQVEAVAERYGLRTCPVVAVDGLPTAFICGVFRPVLVLPAGVGTDDKVILHELLHLRYGDAAWGLVIALFRCLHWCNPLLWLCADWAGNDLESLCDQRVLERLEGEDRRDYGRILLSMADEKYARAPGTSSAANGGKNIRRRIEAITRFKRYPAGMALVSGCVVLVLAVPLLTGVRAETVNDLGITPELCIASARTAWCTTYAGAFDTYAKAVLTQNAGYRAACAPLWAQNALAAQGWREDPADWRWPGPGWRSVVDVASGYQIYNLAQVGEDAYEGLLVIKLYSPPNGEQWSGLTHECWLAVQRLRAEQEEERWVVIPQEGIRAVPGDQRAGGNLGLPARVYEAQYGDFVIRVQWQTTSSINSVVPGGWMTSTFDDTPELHGAFDQTSQSYMVTALYTGDPADRGNYKQIKVEYTPIYDNAVGQDRPKITSERDRWGERDLSEYWDEAGGNWIFLVAGGGGYDGPGTELYQFPSEYAVKLHLNDEPAAELDLRPVEGGEWIEP